MNAPPCVLNYASPAIPLHSRNRNPSGKAPSEWGAWLQLHFVHYQTLPVTVHRPGPSHKPPLPNPHTHAPPRSEVEDPHTHTHIQNTHSQGKGGKGCQKIAGKKIHWPQYEVLHYKGS